MNIIGLYGAFDWDANEKITTADTPWVHDSGCTLFMDGKHICSLNEERYTKEKYDGNFPFYSLDIVLKEGNITRDDVDAVYIAPVHHFIALKQVYSGEAENLIKSYLPRAEINYIGHHLCHAASTVFTSPFNEGSFLTFDGGGSAIHDEFRECIDYIENNSIGYFNKEKGIFKFHNMHENLYNSFGQLYQSASRMIYEQKIGKSIVKNWGDVDASTGKVMGLSAYGSHTVDEKGYLVSDHTIPHITFAAFSDKSKYSLKNWNNIFTPEDAAFYLQETFENGMLNFIRSLRKRHLDDNLCLAGGCFLNVVTNTLIKKSGLFDNIHIPPFVNDSGVHFGAAIWGCFDNNETISVPDNLALLGPTYQSDEVLQYLKLYDLNYEEYTSQKVANLISNGSIVAWFQGRSEHGPRALGSRSIFMSPTKAENKDIMNKRVKHREYWRPFAGIVLEEKVSDYFVEGFISPYMLYTQTSKTDELPAINHVDNTCRIQTVNKNQNPKVYELLTKLDPPVVLNTSFNDNGKPIIENPYQAVQAFVAMDIDILVIGDYIVHK